MANKKKRNKKYQGSNAAVHTTFTKVSAVKRNPVHQWYYDRRRFTKPALITLAVIIVVAICIIGLVSVFTGGH
jgi:hypothetical protein